MAMEKAIKIINEMQVLGIIKKYAVGGAIAAMFYTEPLLTYDLDIFFAPSEESENLLALSPVYEYLKGQGYKPEQEHIIIEGIPVQFLPLYNDLVKEAVDNAVQVEYKDTTVNVLKLEYLLAIMIQTSRPKDKQRIIKFLVEANINETDLERILDKHNLKTAFAIYRSL
jgi:hypothetical protein